MASDPSVSSWDYENEPKESANELLVFGYSCKLFRDDEKANFIDQGHHLIPWMGDDRLLIDRYDVRGAVSDLREAESAGSGEDVLTETEKYAEELCEYERYLALYHDEQAYQLYQEEEAKRLQAELSSDVYTYSQVGFNYDGQPVQEHYGAVAAETAPTEEQQAGYCPMPDEEMFVPAVELNVPSGMPVPETIKQNKIVLKTAKFIAAQGAQMEIVIKTKQSRNPLFAFLSFDDPLNTYYRHMVSMIKCGRYRPDTDENPKLDDSQYLHPTLSSGIKPDLTPGTSGNISIKPSPDCSYSTLIRQIKKQQLAAGIEPFLTSSPLPSAPGSPASVTPQPQVSKRPSFDGTPVPLNTSVSHLGLVDYPSFNHTSEFSGDENSGDELPSTMVDGGNDPSFKGIKWPPPEVQMTIDKMASYMVKNGDEFEVIVRGRVDSRYDFMCPSHEYFPYYRCKLRLYNEVYGDHFKANRESHRLHGAVLKESKVQSISFSIRNREQDVALERRTTFPVESSSSDEDDLDEDEREKRRLAREERRAKRKVKEREERERREKEEREREQREKEDRTKKEEREETEEENGASGDEDLYDIFKYAEELNMQSNNDHIRASCNQKNSSVRSKRSDLKKRIERKRKATAFLATLKQNGDEGGEGVSGVIAPSIYGPELPPEIARQMFCSSSKSPPFSGGSPQSPFSNSPSGSWSPSHSPRPPSEAPEPPPPPPDEEMPPSLIGLSEMFESSRPGIGEMLESLVANEQVSFLNRSTLTLGSELTEKKLKSRDDESRSSIGCSADVASKRIFDRIASRQLKSSRREKLKKHRHNRSSSYTDESPDRHHHKKRKRSRSRTRRHKKARSRSRSHSRSRHGHVSHKKKQRKVAKRRDGKEGKKRRKHRSSSSSSSSDDAMVLVTSDNESKSKVMREVRSQSKRSSRAASVIDLGDSESSHESSPLPLVDENAIGAMVSTSPDRISVSGIVPACSATSMATSFTELTGGSTNPPLAVSSEATKEVKSSFDPQNSAAMAKIASGLRAKIHALLDLDLKM